MTREQIEAAAAERTAQRNFAQVVIAKGWLTPAQISQFDPRALPSPVPLQSAIDTSAVNPSPFNRPPIPAPGGFSPAYRPTYTESVSGATVLVFGVLGLLFCPLFGPLAWYTGGRSLSAIDAGRANPAERTNVSIGRILGIIGSLWMLLIIVFFILGFIASLTGVSNSSPAAITPNFH